MNSIRIALIGFGEWPRQAYAPILAEMPQVKVVTVAARSQKTCRLACEIFGDQVATTNDYRQILGDDKIDAVMIAVPNSLHAEVLSAAAATNKHLFFEPPVATDLDTVQRLHDALAARDRIVQGDLELRYLPVLEAVKSKIASGNLGAARMATIRLWCNWGFQGGPWKDEVQHQSFFHWLGHWYLDVLDAIYGSCPTSANVTGGYQSNGTLMDHGWASLQFPCGGIGQFEFNLTLPHDTIVELGVACERGEIWADLQTGSWRWRGDSDEWKTQDSPASEPVCGFVGMRESIRDFVDAIKTSRPPRADLATVLRVQQSAQMCTDAAE